MSAAKEKVADLGPKLQERAAERELLLHTQPWLVNERPGMGAKEHGALAIEWVNEQYALVDQAGALSVWGRRPDPVTGKFRIYSRKDFETLMEPYAFPTGDEKRPRLAKVWFMHPSRLMGVVGAWPIGQEPENGINLWRGFGIEPNDSDWPTIDDYLLNVVCGGDEEACKYLQRLLAWKVQHPMLPTEVALVLQSDESGTGKSSFGKVLSRIFGHGAKTVADANLLFGRFGETLIGTQVIVLEEALFAPAKSMTDKFKSMVTESTWTVDVKNKAPVSIPNQALFLVNTNHARAIDAMADDRRHFVLKVSSDRAGDAEYWQRLTHAAGTDPTQADLPGFGEELRGFLQSLLTFDLGRWHPRLDIPQTAALQEQKLLSLDGVALLVHEMIEEQSLSWLRPVVDAHDAQLKWPVGASIVPGLAYDGYLGWRKERSLSDRPLSRKQFEMGLVKWMGLVSQDINGTRKAALVGHRRVWLAPHLEAVEKHFSDCLKPRRSRAGAKKG